MSTPRDRTRTPERRPTGGDRDRPHATGAPHPRVAANATGAPHPAVTAVTGATGRLGSRVADRLAASGTALRLVVRDPARAPHLPGAGIARAAYDDADAARAALAGVGTLFLVSAAESPTRVAQHTTFVDAAVAAGVEHIVYTSFLNAASNSTFTLARDHWATEEHIRATGVGFTFLRNNLYADFLVALAGPDGVIRGPAGDGHVAPVVADDVADAAARVLHDPAAHAGRTYRLTGPRSLSLDTIAGIMTAELGRPVTYRTQTIAEAYESRAAYGAPDWEVEAWVSTYTAIAAGELAEVTDDVRILTGHRATTLAQLLRRGTSAY